MILEELDRLCAEKIHGWLYHPEYQRYEYYPRGGVPSPPSDATKYTPTRDINQALDLLFGCTYAITCNLASFYVRVEELVGDEFIKGEAMALNLPLAIVAARLREKGIEVDL